MQISYISWEYNITKSFELASEISNKSDFFDFTSRTQHFSYFIFFDVEAQITNKYGSMIFGRIVGNKCAGSWKNNQRMSLKLIICNSTRFKVNCIDWMKEKQILQEG